MTIAFGLLFLWALTANVIAMFPSPKYHHWPAAYALLVTGTPLLGWILWHASPIAGVAALFIWASTMRWPLIYAGRWVRRRLGLADRAGTR